MPEAPVQIALLIPLAIIIAYYDVRYRRIPNPFVLATLVSGLAMNAMFGGLQGVLASLAGCALGFVLMFMLHVFGAMGAGGYRRASDLTNFSGCGSDRRRVGHHLDYPRWRVSDDHAAGTANPGRTIAGMGNAKIRRSCRSQTHNSLRRSNHNRQHHFNSDFSRLNASARF